MLQLNLPAFQFKLKKENEKLFILDEQRKRYVQLTPEEWVRQNFISFLIIHKGFPASRIAIEKQIVYHGLKKRCDAIFYDLAANPVIIIEFKSPQVKITQQTFDQLAVYNAKLNVDLFMLSNGIEHYCCKIDKANNQYKFFETIPAYNQLF